jgi:hypothetical protein
MSITKTKHFASPSFCLVNAQHFQAHYPLAQKGQTLKNSNNFLILLTLVGFKYGQSKHFTEF